MSQYSDPAQWKRTYRIGNQQINATVLDSNRLMSGAIEVTVRAGCPAPDGEIHYQTNSTTLTDPRGGEQLETFMEHCARWLQKLLFEKPMIKLYVAELLRCSGGYINLPCTINVAQPTTTIDPIFIDAAGAPRVGSFHPPDNPSIELPVHRVHLRFGPNVVEADVLAMRAPSGCVLGGELVQQATHGDLDCLYQVFLSDIVRALGTAARSKRRTVLILGSYSSPGQERLQMIREALEKEDLVGVKLDDFIDIHQQVLV